MPKPEALRGPDHKIRAYKCPECDFEIEGSGTNWHSKAMCDVSCHISLTHRTLPPPRTAKIIRRSR